MKLSSLWPFEPPTCSSSSHSADGAPHSLAASLLAQAPQSNFLTALRKLKSHASSTAPSPSSSSAAGPSNCLASSFVGCSSERSPPAQAQAAHELSWTSTRVILSSGGVPVKSFSFQEGQRVQQALFAFFPLSPSSSSSSSSASAERTASSDAPHASTSASTLDGNFGPFHRPSPPPWTDDQLALASSPSSSVPQTPAKLARWVVVLLADIGYAYPPTGSSVPFQIPFKLGRAWALDRGMLLSRVEERTELGVAGGGEGAKASHATLYSLTHPANEIAPVAQCKSLSNLFPKTSDPLSSKVVPGVEEPMEPLADAEDSVVFVADRRDGAEPLVVSANARSGVISLWSYAHLLSEMEEQRTHLGQARMGAGGGAADGVWKNGNPFGAATKGKERAPVVAEAGALRHSQNGPRPSLSNSVSRRTINTALPSLMTRRKKSSIGGAAIAGDRLQRRASGLGASGGGVALDARSTSFSGQPAAAGGGVGSSAGLLGHSTSGADTSGQLAEADLLEALGESLAMRRTTSSALGNAISAAVDRRTSLTRNELSITMDRMAIGVAQSAEMDREATTILGPNHQVEQEPARSEVAMSKVWEMQMDANATRDSAWSEGMTAHVFDSRSSKGSTLAIAIPKTQTLLLLAITRSNEGQVVGTPLYALSAIACTTVIATRPGVLDLLVFKADNTWSLITASGKEESVVGPPALPSGRSLSKLEGDGTGFVTLTLDDGRRHSTALRAPASGLAGRCLQVVSLSLDLDTFNTFQRSVTEWKQREAQAVSDWDAVEGVILAVFGRPPAPTAPPATTPWAAFDTVSAASDLRDPLVAGLRSSAGAAPASAPRAESSAQLPPHQLEAILLSLHLLAQDCKLRTETQADYSTLADLIAVLAGALGLPQWALYYRTPTSTAQTPPDLAPAAGSRLPSQPHDLISTLSGMLQSRPKTEIWDPAFIGTQLGFTHSDFYGQDCAPCQTTREVLMVYHALTAATAPTPQDRIKMAVLLMDHLGWTIERLDGLAYGVSLPLREALRLCQLDAPDGWPASAYALIRRPDLAMQLSSNGKPFSNKTRANGKRTQRSKLSIDSIANLTKAGLPLDPNPDSALPASALANDSARDAAPVPLAIRYGEDRRLEEVQRMLQFSDPVTVSAGDRTLDQLTPNVQQSVLHALSHRTLALPIGYAMLHFRTKSHASTEAIPIPAINASARILPMLSPVAPLDKDARDGHAITNAERMEWPEFHTGVAAALQLDNTKEGKNQQFDAAQISFNKPHELDAKHAGFLFGLGLGGHAGGMMFSQAFEYLKMKHEPTSIGLLLGLAVTYLGTADPKVTSLLSVHLAALHPPGSSPLNVSSMTQAAGLVGIGLLYMGSQRRSLAEIMLKELCAIKVVTIETANACREAYALSAGFGYGLIMLAKGAKAGSTEPAAAGEAGLLATFRALILGETNHPLPGAAASTTVTDVNITSSPATIALGLMFLRTNRTDVAALLEMPNTAKRLDYVRGDLLLLRTLARCLILWDSVQTGKEWVEKHVPRFIAKAVQHAIETKTVLDTDLDVARWNIIAGACLGMGLKFAGTAAAEAHSTLIHFLDRLTRAAYVKAPTVQAKIKRHAIRCCLSVVGIALSLVMAGTGEINVLRRLRVAHGHFSEGVTYGTHLASHMSLGMLFVGSGYYTLGTSNAAIAALVIAFFPSLPATAGENRAHLQALRHLWVLAVEPRCVEARDVDTSERTFLPIRLRVKEEQQAAAGAKEGTTVRVEMRAKQLVTPTLMPELRLVESIQVDSPRYWTFTLNLASPTAGGAAGGGGGGGNGQARFIADQTLWIKRRTGHLSYAEDPRGIRSIFTRSKSEAGSAVFDWGQTARMLSPSAAGLADFVAAFEDDGVALAAVDWLCFNPASHLAGPNGGGKREEKRASAFEAFASSVLLECLTRDKPDSVHIYLSLFHTRQALAVARGEGQLGTDALLGLEQAQMIVDFYDRENAGGYEALFGAAKSRLKASAARERLIQKALVSHLAQDLPTLSAPAEDAQIEQAIARYLRESVWPGDRRTAARLAMWSAVHKAPDELALGTLREAVRIGAQEGGVEWFVRKVRKAVAEEVGGTRVWSSALSEKLVKALA